MLVIPGGADLPYCKELNGDGNKIIKKYVKAGGRFIGFCAGGYYGSSRLEFEIGSDIEVSGSRELEFFPGIARGTAYKGFEYGSHRGEKAVNCTIENQAFGDLGTSTHTSFVSHYQGGPTFVDADKYPGSEILAKYIDPIDVENPSKAAVVYSKIGNGASVLFGPHCEFEPVLLRYANSKDRDAELVNKLLQSQQSRDYFIQMVLTKLGLKVNLEGRGLVPKLTPLLLNSKNKLSVNEILDKVSSRMEVKEGVILAAHDKFRLSVVDQENSIPTSIVDNEDYADPDEAVKELWAYKNGLQPALKSTPYFNIRGYYAELDACWSQNGGRGSYGNTLLYGEILTSTSSLIEKNYDLLGCLPDGFTTIGTTQVSGRGRGGNVWVSPHGTLAITVITRVNIELAKTTPITFLQYLSSMAMVKAVLEYGDSKDSGYHEMPIRLKWPNDIYLMKPEYFHGKEQQKKYVYEIDPIYAKIGGLLVNTQVQGTDYVCAVGCGMNVSNASPTACLNMVLEKLNSLREARHQERLPLFTLERLAARFIYAFETLVSQFKRSGFTPLLPQYYRYWLHNNQIVTLSALGNTKAKIKGISSNWGLLVVEELDRLGMSTGTEHELLPDGNSFDMFKGLISKKSGYGGN